ncbi:hypothetical protein Plhal304r1_c005g0019401 [Plasmopara halstedii]
MVLSNSAIVPPILYLARDKSDSEMNVYCTALAVAVLMTTLPIGSCTDVEHVLRSDEKASLRKLKSGLLTRQDDTDATGLIAQSQELKKRDKPNDFETNDKWKLAKDIKITKGEATKRERLTSSASPKIVGLNTLSVHRYISKNIWRDITEREDVSAKKGDLSSTPNSEDKKSDKHASFQAKQNEELAKIDAAKVAKVDSVKSQRFQPPVMPKTPESSTSPITGAKSKKIWTDANKKEEMSARRKRSNSVPSSEDKKWKENNGFQTKGNTDLAKGDISKGVTEERANNMGLTTAVPSKVADSNFPSQNIVKAKKVLKDDMKENKVIDQTNIPTHTF